MELWGLHPMLQEQEHRAHWRRSRFFKDVKFYFELPYDNLAATRYNQGHQPVEEARYFEFLPHEGGDYLDVIVDILS